MAIKKPAKKKTRTPERGSSKAPVWNRARRILFGAGVLLLALTVAFFVLNRDESRVSLFENGIGSMFAPVQGVFSSAANNVKDWWERIGSDRTLQAENEELRYANQALSAQLSAASEATIENERLKELLDAKERYQSLDPLYAKVIARDPGTWFDTFSINRGTTDGVSVGMAVATGDGLIGRVFEVGLNYAKVLSIIDSRSSVACLIERTRDNGIMRGQVTGSDSNQDMYVYYLPNVANIVPGDTVITSGLDSAYPKGIPIGTVTAISRDTDTVNQYIVVTPFVDFQHIEEVLIYRTVVQMDTEVLPVVPTATPKPVITADPSDTSNPESQPTADPNTFQYPTATPTPAPTGTEATPADDGSGLPEDSWANQ